MDDKQWQAYEARHAALRRQYRRRRWGIVAISLAYISGSTTALALLVYPYRMDIGLFALIFNFIVSFFLSLHAIHANRAEEQAHREALTEQAPVGKIRLHDD
ncbi:MAG: hypothetical protein IJ518_04645 [Clostridia bacterium]|nr:hypothetical protein [Clostridia bacterium]